MYKTISLIVMALVSSILTSSSALGNAQSQKFLANTNCAVPLQPTDPDLRAAEKAVGLKVENEFMFRMLLEVATESGSDAHTLSRVFLALDLLYDYAPVDVSARRAIQYFASNLTNEVARAYAQRLTVLMSNLRTN